ncbi:MAG: hypothetical protein KDI62_12260, partial [Anaerolineae bacterium]|nr:hypothetical protein [Anaerolineae bacterium]
TDRGRGIHGRTFHSPNGTSSGVRGHNDSGGASRYFWVKKANRLEKSDANHHPTVKPIELMEYIVKMVVPKGGSVIDPFMGSGRWFAAVVYLGSLLQPKRIHPTKSGIFEGFRRQNLR